ncbi:MAG: hypothetical protein R2710_10860 [Acidimicrobiales bacterium]
MVPLPQRVRSSCAALMAEAEFVDIEVDRLAALAEGIGRRPQRDRPSSATLIGRVDRRRCCAAGVGARRHQLRFGLSMSSARTGGCRERTMASRLRAYVGMSGPRSPLPAFAPSRRPTARRSSVELDGGALEELMFHFAVALNDLGSWLDTEFGGSVHREAMAHAGRSAVAFAESLLAMPYYRDVERVDLDDGPLRGGAVQASADHCRRPGARGGPRTVRRPRRTHGLRRQSRSPRAAHRRRARPRSRTQATINAGLLLELAHDPRSSSGRQVWSWSTG